MLFKGTIATQLSGSLAGVTASRNKGGSYFRDRAVPVQPNTIQQQIVKAITGALATRWQQTLTVAQRDAWDLYAFNTPILNAVGDTINITGLNMYIRGNTPRVQAAQAAVDDGPTTFGLPTFGVISLSNIDSTVNQWDLNFDNTDPWANADDAFMFSYGSRPQKPTINFFKGPFQFTDFIAGDATTAPTSPDTQTSNFPFATGDKMFVRVAVVDEQARKSQDVILTGTAI